MIKCFELITVKLADEFVQARPVAWDKEIVDGFGNDKDGNEVTPVEFDATCPKCGNLVHFSTKDIYKVSGDDNIKCGECFAGNERAPDLFKDPISAGVFKMDVDVDLLTKLDSKLAESN